MKLALFRTAVTGLVGIGLAFVSFAASAATGYMSFLMNSPIAVETGDAASYMRVGRDWDNSSVSSSGIAQPTLQQKSTITTSRTSTQLVFQFVIPDNTSGAPNPPLVVGDKVIVQIDPNNSGGTSLQLGSGSPGNSNADYRYEVTIKNRQIVDFSGTTINAPELYLPDTVSSWNFAMPQSTSATAIWKDPLHPGAGGKYEFTLSIPLTELGNPSSDVGVALAILNDLGHSHSTPAVHEFTGTAFPMLMDITPTSEPGIVAQGGVASGNWVIPSSWGTGYFSAPTTADVVFDQLPYPALSYAIRLGNCDSTWDSPPLPAPQTGIKPVPSLTGWEAWQQNSNNNWYVYNPPSVPTVIGEPGPCRMAIWFNAQVKIGSNPAPSSTLTKRRFLVMWGRPGISPQEWYVAGLTAPVTVSGPETQVSFIWNNPPAVDFTGHPCMRVYVLPETLNATHNETFITNIKTQSDLSALEGDQTYFPGGLSNRVAQMNFSNIGLGGGCKDKYCQPLIGFNRSSNLQFASLGGWSLVGEAFAAGAELGTGVSVRTGVKDVPSEKPAPRVFIKATGFGVAAPQGKARYVYVEEIGAVAWAMPSNYVGTTIKGLRFEMANPKVAATTFAGGKMVDIPAPARTLFVAMEAAAPAGTPLPQFDTKNVDEQTRGPIEPGRVQTVEVGLPGPEKCKCACGDVKCRLRCNQLAKNNSGSISGVFALVGALGVGSFAFLRRRRNQKLNSLEELTKD